MTYNYFSVLNGRICCRGKRRQKEVVSSPVVAMAGIENGAVTTEADGNEVELGEVKKKQRPSTAFTIVSINEDAQNQETWKEIARALDRIFFWLFLALFVVSSIVVYSQAGRLS